MLLNFQAHRFWVVLRSAAGGHSSQPPLVNVFVISSEQHQSVALIVAVKKKTVVGTVTVETPRNLCPLIIVVDRPDCFSNLLEDSRRVFPISIDQQCISSLFHAALGEGHQLSNV
jgi:hypothetical protein